MTKIWFPYIVGGSGTDVYTIRLAQNLRELGYEVVTTPLEHRWQYFPWRLKFISPPPDTGIVITNSWNGFAFSRPGLKHICVAHHLVVDPAYRPHRTFSQAVFHELMIRFFERKSLWSADKVVTVSRYTAKKLSEIYKFHESEVIYNGIDTRFYKQGGKRPSQNFRILYVGNLSKRKGADLLPLIMKKLGDGYHLSLTSGLRARDPFSGTANISILGRLTQDELLTAYQNSDILLFPSRLEGFGMACAEAMACELPVVASNCSSLPEIIEDGISGILCPVDHVDAFATAIKKLSINGQENLSTMGRSARDRIVRHFDQKQMAMNYHHLISSMR